MSEAVELSRPERVMKLQDQGLSLREIAAIFNTTKGTLTGELWRHRQALKSNGAPPKVRGMPPRWTEAEIEQLKGLIDSNHTAIQAAAILGRTEDGVRNIARKRKMVFHGVPAPRKPTNRKSFKVRQVGEVASVPSKPVVTRLFGLAVACDPIPLAECERSSCRYPMSGHGADTLFCGNAQQDESSYCAEHHALCRVRRLAA